MSNHCNHYKAQFWCWKCGKLFSWKDLRNNHTHPEADPACKVRPWGVKTP